jgi:membrane-bound lytic murein transglycosylase A
MRQWFVLALVAASLAGCALVPPEKGPPPKHRPGKAKPHQNPVAQKPRPAPPVAPVPNTQPVAPSTANAAGAMLAAGPSVDQLPIDADQAAAALSAFRTSCPSLVRRTDSTGLTRGSDWQPVCAAAGEASDRDARRFFAQWFETVQVGDGKAFATGYYVPELAGSRTRAPGYDVPIYGRPTDLIEADLGLFSDTLKGKKIRGRVDRGSLVPYPDRAAIEAGAIDRVAPVLAWAADPAAVFFLQIQGSGLLRLEDGSVIRLGYDTQNGRDYTGIGALMRQRGLLEPGQASMQGMVAWIHAHPDDGRALMQENKSFVFFRELSGPPLGALGLPVIGGVSAAVDPKFVPLGAPIFLSMDRAEASRLWIAQDTGGAIRGANRVDTFWGAGADAERIAGGMASRGTALLLLPRGTLARLTAEGAGGGAQPNP